MALQLRTTIVSAGPAVAVVLTDAEVDALGGGRRAAVRVTIGGVTERLRIAVMGGRILIGLRKEVRAAFGVSAGDTVDARIELDEAPREVAVPADLAAALGAAGVRAAFDALSYSHRREHVTAIEDAKKPETRARRIAAAVARVAQAG